MKVVVLLSGGMDSVTALYHANEEHEVVGALSFNYGSKHNHKEIPFAELHCSDLGIPQRTISLDFINELFNSLYIACYTSIFQCWSVCHFATSFN